jgi:hypothetical protein
MQKYLKKLNFLNLELLVLNMLTNDDNALSFLYDCHYDEQVEKKQEN